MHSDRKSNQQRLIRSYMLTLMFIWTFVAGISLFLVLDQHKQAFYAEAYAQAKGIHTMDMAYRNWVIGNGGVYVPVTEQTLPNDFMQDIPERDVTTPSGKVLTLVNSSYMTRQVHQLMDQHDAAVSGHIASLKPSNPLNKADSWETAALKAFERGEKEVSGLTQMADGRTYFRYMQPMVTEQSCLKCHAGQGYKEGDVRGGISVSIPVDAPLAIEDREMQLLLSGYGSIWGLGMAILFIGARHQQKSVLQVEKSAAEVKLMANSIAHAIYGQNLSGCCTFANAACVKMLGYEREEQLLGEDMHALMHYKRADGTSYPAAECPTHRSITEGKRFHIDEEWLWRKDGSGFPAEYWSYPIMKKGQCLGAVATFLDITEMKRSQKLLDSIVEHVPAMIFLKSATDLRFVLFNHAGERMLGYSRHELLGRNDHDLFPQEQADFFSRKDREVLDSRTPLEIPEEPVRTAEGGEKWLHTIKIGLYDERQQATHLLGISMDITARKQAETRLRKSRKILAEAQRIAHIGSWELDLVTNTLYWSDEIYRIFEIDAQQFGASYEAFLDAIHPEDRESVNKAYTDSLQKRTPYQIEHRLLMKNGSVKYVLERCETVYDENGNALRSTGTVQDVSERKQAEIALRESKEQYDDMAKRIPAGIYLYRLCADGSDRFDYVSPRFCQILNVVQAEVSHNAGLVFTGAYSEDRESLLCANRRAVETKQPLRWEGRFPIRGEIRWIKIESDPTVLPTGDSLWNGVVTDITERKLAEIALGHANRALHTLSTVNRELVRASEENALLQAICAAIVDQQGYRMVWVGYVQHDQNKSIKRVASCGDTHGVLEKVRPTWAEEGVGSGPSGHAVRSGQTQICGDITADPQYQPWSAELVRQGCVSSIALPLRNNGEVFGILHAYGDEVNAFTRKEVSLLEEMANDLAFGVRSLRIRRERDRAMQLNAQHLALMHEVLQQTVTAISKAVEARDPYTAGHQRRVADLACAIARQMALDDDQIEGIRMGATIHDIGKIQIPAEMLTKPYGLTRFELLIIREHPRVGYEILKDIHFPWPVSEIAFQHHERMDGSGYPQGLKGDQICLEARIVTVADVVEAMSSHRPYRASLGIEAALAEIRENRGTYYDAQVVDACLALFAGGYQLS